MTPARSPDPAAEAVSALQEPGQTAYGARFAGQPQRHFTPWHELPADARAVWVRIEMACQAPISADIAALRTRAEEAERERDEAAALVTAWEGAADALEAHLQDRIAMNDPAKPAVYLNILRAEVGSLPTRSRQIYAATQHRAAAGQRQAEKADGIAQDALKRSRLANSRADAITADRDRLAEENARLRSTGAGRSEAEAAEPERDVRPPGETLWLAHGAVFGAANGPWDDLALIDKLRWASVEDSAIRALPVQTTGGAGD